MFGAIKELPEKTRKRLIIILATTAFALVVLAIVGSYLARGPLPEMIIAPASAYFSQA